MSYITKPKPTGPSSSKKSKRGGRYKGANKTSITDYDTTSCFPGVIKGYIIHGKDVIVTNMIDNKDVVCHCRRNIQHREILDGAPVIFAINRTVYDEDGKQTSASGEVIKIIDTDTIDDFCIYFKLSETMVKKQCKLNTSVMKQKKVSAAATIVPRDIAESDEEDEDEDEDEEEESESNIINIIEANNSADFITTKPKEQPIITTTIMVGEEECEDIDSAIFARFGGNRNRRNEEAPDVKEFQDKKSKKKKN
jgi:hypothetical protein